MMRAMNRMMFLIVLCCPVFGVEAQSSNRAIDSLLVVLETAKEDTGKVNTLNEIAWAYRNIGKAEKGNQFADQALALAEPLQFKKGIARAYNTKGVLNYDQNNYDAALEDYAIAIAFRQEIGDKAGTAGIYNNIGNIYIDLNQLPEALKNHLSALKIREEIGNRRGMAFSYNNIGNIYFRQNLLGDAINSYEAARLIFESLGDKKGIASSYTNLGIIYDYQGDHSKALENHRASLALSEEMGDRKAMCGTLINIGVTLKAYGDYESALRNYKSALRICEEIGDKKGMAGAYNNIGIIHDDQGNYPEALKYYQSALTIKEQIGDKNGAAVTQANMGTIFDKQGHATEALRYYNMALKIHEQTGDKKGMALCHGNIGIVLNEQRQYEEALNHLSTALQINEEIGLPAAIATSNSNIGDLLVNQGLFSEARSHYQMALNLFEEIDSKEGKASTYINLGNIFINLAAHENPQEASGSFQSAIENIQKGLALAKEIKARSIIQNAYRLLGEAYKRMREYREALEYNTLYVALKDSLLNNETTRKLEQLRTQYEVEKAVTSEKAKQDSLLAEQKFLSAKEQAEINTRHELTIAQAKAQKEKAIEVARIRYQMDLAAAKTEQEKLLAEQQFQSELQLAEENSRHQLAMADEKAKEERAKAQRKRAAELILTGIALLALISFFILLYIRQRNLKRKAIEKAETVHKMAELELQSLRAQMNPHFMFNSLNAIQELILMEENDKSHTYLARFAKLLRMLLENANSPFIPLAREIEFLQLYLSLEKLRIPDLKYNIQVDPGINTEQIKIPNMILQPYIENAIWHGLSHKQHGDRKIEIRVNKDSMGVKYEIEDNGVGRKRAEELKSAYRKEHRSKGMELLTKRFKLLNEEYQSRIETQVEDISHNLEAKGTKVAIRVPWAMAKAEESLAF